MTRTPWPVPVPALTSGETFASLFSGFGGADIGAQAAGLELAWGIELDPAIAAVANRNLGGHVTVANILDCDPRDFAPVDVLHASPPCPSFSVASQGSETELDIALARRVAYFVTMLQPRIFTLENVWAYRNSVSWRIVEDALHMAGYWVHVDHVNAADFSVPQTRKRMIVRAIRGGFVPYLPEPVPWVGWYEAIEDLLPTLPESQFAPWQLKRLPELQATTLVANGGFNGEVVRVAEQEPSFTITASMNGTGLRAQLFSQQSFGGEVDSIDGSRPAFTITANSNQTSIRAWLVEGANASRDMTIRTDDQPVMTIGAGGAKVPLRVLSHAGRIVAMTPRCLARFQSFPDTYRLPDNARLAAKGLGNAVPPLMYQRIIAPLLEASCP